MDFSVLSVVALRQAGTQLLGGYMSLVFFPLSVGLVTFTTLGFQLLQ